MQALEKRSGAQGARDPSTTLRAGALLTTLLLFLILVLVVEPLVKEERSHKRGSHPSLKAVAGKVPAGFTRRLMRCSRRLGGGGACAGACSGDV